MCVVKVFQIYNIWINMHDDESEQETTDVRNTIFS